MYRKLWVKKQKPRTSVLCAKIPEKWKVSWNAKPLSRIVVAICNGNRTTDLSQLLDSCPWFLVYAVNTDLFWLLCATLQGFQYNSFVYKKACWPQKGLTKNNNVSFLKIWTWITKLFVIASQDAYSLKTRLLNKHVELKCYNTNKTLWYSNNVLRKVGFYRMLQISHKYTPVSTPLSNLLSVCVQGAVFINISTSKHATCSYKQNDMYYNICMYGKKSIVCICVSLCAYVFT